MKVLLKSVKNLLSENLSTAQRGILITAVLCKDVNERTTLAKFKTFVSVKDFRKDLIDLQERGFIKWSGYNRAKKAEENKKQDPKIVEIIEFFNNLCKRKVNPNTDSQTKELRNRLLEYSIDEIKLVISNRYEVWKDDNVMKHHLQPTTLFRKSKFDKYIEEAVRTKVGSGIVSVSKSTLKENSPISYSDLENFAENDVYKVKVYRTNHQGKQSGNGVLETHLGKDLKRIINIQNNLIKSVGKPNFIYIFVGH